MEIQKIKVSAVSYLNTLPFLYGIKHSKVKEELDLTLDIPSDCAKKLLSGEIHLGLVPIAIIPELEEHYIISDYCIGSKGKVDSVALFSDVPLDQIETVYLDYQSKTSVNLVQILAKEFWNISPKWINATLGFENEIRGRTAAVIIGDRTFNLPKKYPYKYDLSEQWYDFTGLPFVFACWVANKELSPLFINKFNEALIKGLENIHQVVNDYDGNSISKKALDFYLTKNISYSLDNDKQKAIELFLQRIENNKSSLLDG